MCRCETSRKNFNGGKPHSENAYAHSLFIAIKGDCAKEAVDKLFKKKTSRMLKNIRVKCENSLTLWGVCGIIII